MPQDIVPSIITYFYAYGTHGIDAILVICGIETNQPPGSRRLGFECRPVDLGKWSACDHSSQAMASSLKQKYHGKLHGFS